MNAIKSIFKKELIGKTLDYLSWGDEDEPPQSRHYGKKINDVIVAFDECGECALILIMDDNAEIPMILDMEFKVS